jgi:two-component system sensor histidine kinase/response regulator
MYTDTLLIVDDNPQNIDVLFQLLDEHGFEVLIAEDGEDGLQSAQREHPNLILLDVMMPGIDGFETCRRLKQNPETKEIPVIFMTALSEIESKVRAFEIGAVDYVTKPFQREEVLARINAHLTIRRLQRELEQKNQYLEALNREKNEFLGIAAHDLKNPLSAIQGLAEMIKLDMTEEEECDKEKVSQFATDIYLSARHMFELIINLLDVNKIESGKISLYFQTVDLKLLLKQLVKSYEERALAKQLTLQLQIPSEPCLVLVDEDITWQILDNLISNAIKYSPFKKNIFIQLNQTDNVVQCMIRDEGVGLSPTDQKQLFGKFKRLTPRPTNEEHSTGLGLYIVKKLIDAMEGKVWCESTLGKGSTFFVEFAKLQ